MTGEQYSNVFLITVDCFRYDRCSFNGYSEPTTPFLDTLADEAYIFDNAYATGPYTAESFPGLLAGLHANSAPYVSDTIYKAIPEGGPTIASWLRDEGYETRATITNTQLSRRRNFDTGFESFDNIRLESSETMVERNDGGESILPNLSDIQNLIRSKAKTQSRYPNPYLPVLIAYRWSQLSNWPTVDGRTLVSEFLQNLPDNDTSSPTFGWCHFMDPHAPLHPDTEQKIHDVGGKLRQLAAGAARICDIAHPRYSQMYDNTVRYVDQQIQELFSQLERRGLLDDAAVIITGDHGEALGERGVYDHHWHYMFEELLRVPLLVWTSGDDGNRQRISNPFSLAWMHELIAELTGTETGPLPATSKTHEHLDDNENGPVVADSVSNNGYSIAIRSGTLKYIVQDIGSMPYITHKEKFEDDIVVIDLEEDPFENSKVLSPQIPAEITALLEEHKTEASEVPALSDTLGSEAEDRLKKLGYKE